MYLPEPKPKRDTVIAMVDGELREIERSEWRRLQDQRGVYIHWRL